MSGGDFTKYNRRYKEYTKEFEECTNILYTVTRAEEVSKQDHKRFEINREKREEKILKMTSLEFKFKALQEDITFHLKELREEKTKWKGIVADIQEKRDILNEKIDYLYNITV